MGAHLEAYRDPRIVAPGSAGKKGIQLQLSPPLTKRSRGKAT